MLDVRSMEGLGVGGQRAWRWHCMADLAGLTRQGNAFMCMNASVCPRRANEQAGKPAPTVQPCACELRRACNDVDARRRHDEARARQLTGNAASERQQGTTAPRGRDALGAHNRQTLHWQQPLTRARGGAPAASGRTARTAYAKAAFADA